MAEKDMAEFGPDRAEYVLWVEVRHLRKTPVEAKLYRYDLGYLKTVDKIELPEEDGGLVEIRSADTARIVVHWDGERNSLPEDSRTVTNRLGCRRSLLDSAYSLNLVFSFQHLPAKYSDLFNLIIDIGMDRGGSETLIERQVDVLRFIDIYIERGYTGLYIAKALLVVSSDWSRCKMSDFSYFRKMLLEGIEKGCLAYDNHIGWNWMMIASKCNDPAEFMEDMDRYYDLLADASEHGVIEARDIMDMIWEPENCIEED